MGGTTIEDFYKAIGGPGVLPNSVLIVKHGDGILEEHINSERTVIGVSAYKGYEYDYSPEDVRTETIILTRENERLRDTEHHHRGDIIECILPYAVRAYYLNPGDGRDKELIAAVDRYGVIHFPLISYYSRKYDLSEIWAREFPDYDPKIERVNAIIKDLKKVKAENVESVKIKTRFSKKQFLEETRLKILESLNQIEGSYNARIKSINRIHNENIKSLGFSQIRDTNAAFIAGQELHKNKDWELFEDDGNHYLKYVGPVIYADKIKDDETEYIILKKYKTRFYIKDIIILLEPDINIAHSSKANHPNVDIKNRESIEAHKEIGFNRAIWSLNQVCMGDLKSQSIIRVINELPGLLKTINMDSKYGDQKSAKQLYKNVHKFVKKDVEVNVWRTE